LDYYEAHGTVVKLESYTRRIKKYVSFGLCFSQWSAVLHTFQRAVEEFNIFLHEWNSIINFHMLMLFITRDYHPSSNLGRKVRKGRRPQRELKHLVQIHHRRRFLREE
jgi:hypothetical protein